MKDPYKPGGGQSKFIRNTGTDPVKGKAVKNKNVRVAKAKKLRKKI